MKTPPFRARYKSRTPDPGECVVKAIDWEDRRVTMTNGANTYFPTFEKIEMWQVAWALYEHTYDGEFYKKTLDTLFLEKPDHAKLSKHVHHTDVEHVLNGGGKPDRWSEYWFTLEEITLT